MTKMELKQLSHLKEEIKLLDSRIKEIESFSTSATSYISGLPGAPQKTDKLSDCAILLVELKQKLKAATLKCMVTAINLYEFIQEIPDSELRMIFSLRYEKNMSWQSIAWHLGYDGDGSTERKKHDRYLSEMNIKCA